MTMNVMNTAVTGDWVSFDGYIYRVLSVRHVTDLLVLERFTEADLMGEDYLILKKHSHLLGSWVRTSIEIARSRYCQMLNKEEQTAVDECNENRIKYLKFERYSSTECNYVLQHRYNFSNEEECNNFIDIVSSTKPSFNEPLSTKKLRDKLMDILGYDIYKYVPTKLPNNSLQVRLVIRSQYMQVDREGNLLITDIAATPISR